VDGLHVGEGLRAGERSLRQMTDVVPKAEGGREEVFDEGVRSWIVEESVADLGRMKETAAVLDDPEESHAVDATASRRVCLRPDVRPETSRALFDTYDAFLGTLGDPERRDALKRCQQEDLGNSDVFRDMSRLARRFQEEGVKRLFFGDDPILRDLTVDYGVF